MEFVQKSNFLLLLFFTEIISEKIVVGYLWKKTIILRPKNWSFKKGQKWTFSNGVSPWILSKNRTFSHAFLLQKLCQKKSFFDNYERRQSFWDQKIEVLKRAEKWTFSKGVSPWILSKNRTFSYRCFLQKLCQKRSFFDIYERKQLCLDQKLKI